MTNPHHQAPVLRHGVVAGFGAGALGVSLGAGVIPLLFLFYLTEFAKVPPAVAGILLALPKLTDLLLDPVIGRRTDQWARRSGSRGHLIAIGTVALPIVLILLFVPMNGLPLPLRVGVLGMLLIVQAVLLTVFAVAHTAIVSDLADDMTGRTRLMSARALGQTIAGLAVSVAAPQLASAFQAHEGGYLGMATVLAVAAFIACALCLVVVRRVPMRVGATSEHAQPLLPALRATLRNRTFYCIVAILILLGASTTALFSALPFANKHLLHGAPEQLSLLLTPVFLALLVGVTCAPWLTARLRIQTLLSAALILALAGVIWFTSGPRVQASIVTGGIVFGFAIGVLTVLISTLAIEAATKMQGVGESLGLYLGILFSAEKLGQSLGGIVMGFGLDWVGRLDTPLAAANSAALDRLAWLYAGAPAAALLAAILVLFPLATRLHKEATL